MTKTLLLPTPLPMPRFMTDYSPPEGPLRIIHNDEHVVLVDKPTGLLSVPGKPAEHGDCVLSRVEVQFPGAQLIHRLDLETSGMMIFAMNARAQRIINRQFEQRLVHKVYVALVDGRPREDEGVIDLPLTGDWPRRPLQKVCFETGKPARTRWRAIGHGEGWTRLRLWPETGRTHQLRVHLKEIGHPILGDPFYAPDPVYDAATRLMLHATRLMLRHPGSGRRRDWRMRAPF
ncbi:MAG: pseudouridine synthase [Pseudomonadota bacterium]